MTGANILLHRLAEFQPVEPRQHTVGDDDVGFQRFESFEDLVAVGNRLHVIMGLEMVGDITCHLGIGLGQENRPARLLRRLLGRREIAARARPLLGQEFLGVADDRGPHVVLPGALPGRIGLDVVGQRDGEFRKMPRLAPQRDRTLVQFDDATDDRQSDARTGMRFVDLVEPFEDALLLVLRNTDAGIADRKAKTPFAALQGNANDAAVGRELEGVRQQVREHHFEEHPVDGQRLAVQFGVEDIVHVAVLGHLLEHREDLGDDGVDILHGDLHFEHLQLGFAVVEQLVDDVQQLEAVAVDVIQARGDVFVGRTVFTNLLQGRKNQRQRRAQFVREVDVETDFLLAELADRLLLHALQPQLHLHLHAAQQRRHDAPDESQRQQRPQNLRREGLPPHRQHADFDRRRLVVPASVVVCRADLEDIVPGLEVRVVDLEVRGLVPAGVESFELVGEGVAAPGQRIDRHEAHREDVAHRGERRRRDPTRRIALDAHAAVAVGIGHIDARDLRFGRKGVVHQVVGPEPRDAAYAAEPEDAVAAPAVGVEVELVVGDSVAQGVAAEGVFSCIEARHTVVGRNPQPRQLVLEDAVDEIVGQSVGHREACERIVRSVVAEQSVAGADPDITV